MASHHDGPGGENHDDEPWRTAYGHDGEHPDESWRTVRGRDGENPDETWRTACCRDGENPGDLTKISLHGDLVPVKLVAQRPKTSWQFEAALAPPARWDVLTGCRCQMTVAWRQWNSLKDWKA